MVTTLPNRIVKRRSPDAGPVGERRPLTAGELTAKRRVAEPDAPGRLVGRHSFRVADRSRSASDGAARLLMCRDVGRVR